MNSCFLKYGSSLLARGTIYVWTRDRRYDSYAILTCWRAEPYYYEPTSRWFESLVRSSCRDSEFDELETESAFGDRRKSRSVEVFGY